jgi:hypothetical protein
VGHGHVAFGSKSDIRLPRRDAGLHAFGRHSFDVIDKERGPLLPFFALYGAVFCALVICPSGKKGLARQNLSSPRCKKNLLRERPKSDLQIWLSRSERGALAIVTNVGMGCGGRGSAGRAEMVAGRASRP